MKRFIANCNVDADKFFAKQKIIRVIFGYVDTPTQTAQKNAGNR